MRRDESRRGRDECWKARCAGGDLDENLRAWSRTRRDRHPSEIVYQFRASRDMVVCPRRRECVRYSGRAPARRPAAGQKPCSTWLSRVSAPRRKRLPMKTLLAWSSGKDSAWTLQVLRQQGIQVSALLTTTNAGADRVAMHGVRSALLDAQAESIGIPLWKVPLPWPCSNDDYERRMAEACARAVAEGFDTIAFGDLFLEDIRQYRERQLAGNGLTPLFPLWQIPTGQLARDMIAGGLRARLACVDTKVLSAEFAGREFDARLLSDLPAGVDPCGENGEVHTFVYGGPMFRTPIEIETAEVHEAGQFVYRDLVPCPVSSL